MTAKSVSVILALGAIAISVYGYVTYREKERQVIIAKRTRQAEIELAKRQADAEKQITENRVKELHEEATITELCKELGSDDTEIRREAFLALNQLGPAAAPAVPALISILESSTDPARRAVAATILGHIGVAAEPALPALEQAIADAIRAARNAKRMILMELRKTGKQ
jgi:transposase